MVTTIDRSLLVIERDIRDSRLRFINIILDGLWLGDQWFNEQLEWCKLQWPDETQRQIMKR